MSHDAPIVVFSHLRWDWVYQRPQHLLSRLAANRRVYFIEEPQLEPGGESRWNFSEPEPNVLVCRPLTPIPTPGFSDEQMPALETLLHELIRISGLDRDSYVVWFYTPMALPLLKHLRPMTIVYDVMDELSAFKGAPPALLEREAELYKVADVVFTGGPSLYRAKQDRHPNVHCFPSSVDARHFAAAKNKLREPEDQRDLPHPRLGFYGVIDERMDLKLLEAMAVAHPEWQIVMVGPVIKINPSDLPRQPNILYTGQRQYADLPAYLAGWDVCLLPFARNESTRFISPTKTLEYMAAEKPIVSTPITDVAEPYGDIVLLGDTPEQFVAACEKALALTGEERAASFQKMRKVLAATSWDATVKVMSGLIEEAIQLRQEHASREEAQNRLAKEVLLASAKKSRPVVVIGAGPTGLSAAYHLGESAILLEKNDSIGGWCRSLVDRGFTFDFAGHIMFSNDPYVHELYKKLLGDNVHWQDREAWIYSKGVYTRYPFQGCLYGLPPEVIKECIIGAIEARFGSLKPQRQMEDAVARAAQEGGHGQHGGARGMGPSNRNGQAKAGNSARASSPVCTSNPGQKARNILGPGADGKDELSDCCGDGVLESTAELATREDHNGNGAPGTEPRNFEEFIYKVWGKGIARHFAIPYNRKIWAVDLKEMETSWLGGRVPMPDIEEMILYALTPAAKPMGPNARFGYPLRGGFQALMNGFLPHLRGQLRLNTGVQSVSPSRHTLTLNTGEVLRYEYLISTMPLPLLIRAMGQEAPETVQRAAAALRYTNVRCVNIGVGRENITEKHWIYYPEDTIFHRIFVQGNASPYCNPAGGFGFTCEITYGPQKPLPCDGQDLIDLCIRDARRVQFIREDDPIWCANQVDMPCAYVIYDHARPANVKLIRDWLLTQDIILAGRYSEWEYYNSDHAFIAGKKAAETVRELLEARTLRRQGKTTQEAIGAMV
ncbi:MAG TPA: FAD-dependent oxidoreductase [Phycisphaerae bacterium]|nr:FAD-dependent oxidoreductase [Phycisphaerae bacterium]